MEVVATQVEETRVGGETPRNFGVTAVLTRGVMCLSLKTDRDVIVFSELEVLLGFTLDSFPPHF